MWPPSRRNSDNLTCGFKRGGEHPIKRKNITE
jgi:hypothetical protein